MQRDAPVRRLALLVEYEGTAYRGSQYQRDAPTIQASLERALSSLTGELTRVTLAGRTDSGVHARGQVASFLTASSHSVETFMRGLNALLAGDIAIRAAAEVPLGFDPRRQAQSRWYRYTIHVGRQRPALLRHLVWHVGQSLDVTAMAAATGALPGRHDFAAFTPPSEAGRRRTERVVMAAQVNRCGKGLVCFDIEANAFLPHMARRLVAAMVEVGLGKRTAAEIEALLQEARPGTARSLAPARGLCLMKVRYESGLFDDETDEEL